MSAGERIRRRRGAGPDVVVAGGGMGGAAAALALAREGFSVTLVEAREPAPWHIEDEVDLRVVALAPSSAGLLERLGVWASIRDARVGPYRAMHVWDAESGAALDFDAAERGRRNLGWIVENRLVQQALWQALDAAAVQVSCPSRVLGFDAGEDGVAVALDDGRTLQAQLLVAADGAGSPLRELAGIGTRGRDYGQRAVVAHVHTQRPHQHAAWQRFQPGGPVALLPLADGRCSVVWSLPDARAQQVLTLDDEAFCNALSVATDFRLGPITATSARAAFPLRLRLAERYESDRFVLLGDAAHAVHPLAGQGVNLGLRDVEELVAILVAARERGVDIGDAGALRRYARRRRSADTLDAYGFDTLSRVFDWERPPAVAARGLGVRLVDRLGPLKRALAAHAAGR